MGRGRVMLMIKKLHEASAGPKTDFAHHFPGLRARNDGPADAPVFLEEPVVPVHKTGIPSREAFFHFPEKIGHGPLMDIAKG